MARFTVRAAAVLPVRVTVNTPAAAPASAAFPVVAAIVTPLGGAMSVRQALVPALVGALDVAVVGATLMSAMSVLPTSSVTVSLTTIAEPDAGAVTVTLVAVAPVASTAPELTSFHS